MGFYSYNCKGCNSSLKAPYGVPEALAWQNTAVLVDPTDGTAIVGKYDGYGRLEGAYDVEFDDSPIVWHARCYHDASPQEKGDLTPSEDARDQGYFYDDEDSGSHTILD
tara:strand:- start:3454 stop:3780 length:327 start_codon:yes stop_codon:yes gene_type:complete